MNEIDLKHATRTELLALIRGIGRRHHLPRLIQDLQEDLHSMRVLYWLGRMDAAVKRLPQVEGEEWKRVQKEFTFANNKLAKLQDRIQLPKEGKA